MCVCVWVCLCVAFVSLFFLALLGLEGRGRRLMRKKGWYWGNGVWTHINNEGCRLCMWLKTERLISLRAQHQPPGVLITALQRGSGHFCCCKTNSACFCSPDLRSLPLYLSVFANLLPGSSSRCEGIENKMFKLNSHFSIWELCYYLSSWKGIAEVSSMITWSGCCQLADIFQGHGESKTWNIFLVFYSEV